MTLRYSPPRITPTTTPRTYIRPSVRSLDHHLPGSKCDDGDDRDDQDVIVMIMIMVICSFTAGLMADRVRDQQQRQQQQQDDQEEEELATPWLEG